MIVILKMRTGKFVKAMIRDEVFIQVDSTNKKFNAIKTDNIELILTMDSGLCKMETVEDWLYRAKQKSFWDGEYNF